MLTPTERAKAAALLWDAEASRQPCEPLTDIWPSIDVDDAYSIQLTNIDRHVADGRRVVGHKVGLSAKAMQQMVGVDEPDYGHLLDDMFVHEGDVVRTDRLSQPRVEVEVAFVLGATLRGPGVTVADVLRATEYVMPALEIVASRVRDWKVKIQDTVADNASSGLVVLGGRKVRPHELDLRTIGAVLCRNGRIHETGASGAVLGNPATAVAWLANKVAGYGVTLEPGHVIMPGSCTRMFAVEAGDFVRADLDGLGYVSCVFE